MILGRRRVRAVAPVTTDNDRGNEKAPNAYGKKFRSDLPAARGEDFDKSLRATRTAVERDAAGLADGDFAEKQQARLGRNGGKHHITGTPPPSVERLGLV